MSVCFVFGARPAKSSFFTSTTVHILRENMTPFCKCTKKKETIFLFIKKICSDSNVTAVPFGGLRPKRLSGIVTANGALAAGVGLQLTV